MPQASGRKELREHSYFHHVWGQLLKDFHRSWMWPTAGSESNPVVGKGGTKYSPAGPEDHRPMVVWCIQKWIEGHQQVHICKCYYKYKYKTDLKACSSQCTGNVKKTTLCHLRNISLWFWSFLDSCFYNKIEGNAEVESCFVWSLPKVFDSAWAFLFIFGLFCRNNFAELTQICKRVLWLLLHGFRQQ